MRACTLLISLAIGLQFSQNALARDLEVVETFWTDPAKNASPGVPLAKVEVDRADKHGTFVVVLSNRSRQDITAIRATISLPAGIKHRGGSASTPAAIYSGSVRLGDTFSLLFPLEIAESFDNKGYRCPMTIEYFSIAKNQSFTENVDCMLRMTGRTQIVVTANGSLQPGKIASVPIKIANRGTARAEALTLTFSAPADATGALPIALAPGSPNTLDVAALDPGQSIDVSAAFVANSSAAGRLHSLVASLKYNDACQQTVTVSYPLTIGVFARPLQPLVDLQSSGRYLTAQPSMVSELEVTVTNRSNQALKNVSIAATGPVESLKILGQPRWLLEELAAGASQSIKPIVYVSKELTERATTLSFTIQAEVDGLPYQQSSELGLFVEGTVSLRVQDAAIVSIGGTPNLTGNLLNDGSGTARFASLEIVPDDNWKAPLHEPLYLGDIVENSPQPFSLPLNAGSQTTDKTKVQLRLTYKNVLRESQSLEVSTTLRHSVEEAKGSEDADTQATQLPSSVVGWFVGGIALGLCLAMLWRLRRTTQLTRLLHEQKLQGRKSLDQALDARTASNRT